jgi:hypothetical protein
MAIAGLPSWLFSLVKIAPLLLVTLECPLVRVHEYLLGDPPPRLHQQLSRLHLLLLQTILPCSQLKPQRIFVMELLTHLAITATHSRVNHFTRQEDLLLVTCAPTIPLKNLLSRQIYPHLQVMILYAISLSLASLSSISSQIKSSPSPHHLSALPRTIEAAPLLLSHSRWHTIFSLPDTALSVKR